MVSKYISQLLFEHECVIIPGLGGFLSSYAPAYIHPVTHRFAPPHKQLAFNAELSGNDGLLINFTALSRGISFQEASMIIHDWVDRGKNIMNSGGKIVIEHVGVLNLNKEGSIQFEAFNSMNFMEESFGLPTFVTHPLVTVKSVGGKKETSKVPRVIQNHDKIRQVVVSAVKWAAVLAPFVAFTFWGISNQEIIGSLSRNYTGMFTWSRATPGKTITIPKKQAPPVADELTYPSPGEYILKANPNFEPSVYAYQSLKEASLVIESDQNVSENKTVISDSPGYRIVLGAFQSSANADNLIEELKVAGFGATVLGNTKKGLALVGMRGFKNKAEALAKKTELDEAGFTTACLLKE